jgi:hypothetical protein
MRNMPDILCIQCGDVGPDKAGHCAHCGSSHVVPADAPLARKFIEDRDARKRGAAPGNASLRTEATGKVLGRALGRFFKK